MKLLLTLLPALLTQTTGRRNQRIVIGFLLFTTVLVALFSIVFHQIMAYEGRDYSYITGVYWTLTVMSTLGFGDITFTSDIGKLFSIIVLFLLAKLMGNRQVSQMSMFDYVNGITIGSIAAEFATSLEDDYWMPLTAMVVYGVTAALISYITCKSMAARKFINGKPVVLYENGKLYEKNLAAAKLDINEFLTQCRTAGYFDLADLQTAILETNGQVSFLPLAAQRPVTPEDLQMTPDPERPCVNVILDGTVIPKNLKYTGNDDVWLKKQLEAQHVTRIGDVFLATVNAQNELDVYPRTGERVAHEMFE